MMIIKKLIFVLCIGTASLHSKEWEQLKAKTIADMSKIPGWCSEEKARLMMDLIKQHKLMLCVELGVFSGKSLLPIAKAVQYNGQGHVHGIDAWNAEEAMQGVDVKDPKYSYWKKCDFHALYKGVLHLLQRHRLYSSCTLVRKSAKDALHKFSDRSIDFIHIDENCSEACALSDVASYFPKVKNDGYIVLSNATWYSMRFALMYLLERADLLSEFTPTAEYYLFRKNEKKTQNSQALLKNP
jgi:predicted O-methyltransferase YrrM